MSRLLSKITSFYRNKLSYNQDNKNIESLTKWSILLIIILDIFVYSCIQLGIDFQTSTLNNPETKITYDCKNILNSNEQIKNPLWYKYKFSKVNNTNSSNVYINIKNKELDKRCSYINKSIETISSTIELQNIQIYTNSLTKALTKYKKELSYIQKNYNTSLFEKMAVQKNPDFINEVDLDTKNIKIKYDNVQSKVKSIQNQIKGLKNKFANHDLIQELDIYIIQNKNAILDDYNKLKNRYYIKKIGINFLFLFPITLLFYWQMSLQNIKRNYTKYIICKNVFLISLIFLIYSLLSIIYKFIPHVFLEKVLLFFYSLNIPFFAYYILLAIGIFIFSFIILKTQNFTTYRKKTTIDFIENYRLNKCDKCGLKVDYKTMNYCPNCKNALKISCKNCGKHTISKFEFCSNCGDKLPNLIKS